MIGRTISHYKILEKLGEGGMGVVYKAEDTKLKRTVALKFLPPELTRDSEAKERFIHEARAAAALNHSNICTIHEINEAEGQSFIAMECMEGQSLKDKITAGPLKMEEAMDIATQVAQGLDKAHQQGIVHRDIKPANIFVTGDGVVKILDFGLAKLRGQKKLTKEGTTVGTVAYMSPEQARGDEVDHRTDVWSLGIVLYEMVTGQLPFKGDYEQAVVYSILNEEAESMTGLRTGVPMELERIVNKAMEKSPGDRYQHVGEMLVDLRSLRKAPPQRPEKEIIPRGMSKALLGIVAIGLCCVVLIVGYLFVRQKKTEFQIIRTQPLTTAPGLEQDPAWSPEGTRIAYTSDESGNMDIWVRQIAAGQRVNLTKEHKGYDGKPAWSPDGEWIAFVSNRDGGGIFVMPALGGIPKRMVSHSFAPALSYIGSIPTVCWSPDGTELAYAAKGSLYTISVEGGMPAPVPLPPSGLMAGFSEPAWSPDGERIACTGFLVAGVSTSQIWSLRLDGTDPLPVTEGRYYDLNPVWSPDGRQIFFISDRGGNKDVWWVSVDARGETAGPPRPLTAGAGVGTIALSGDGTKLAYSKVTDRSNIRSIPIVSDRKVTLDEALTLTSENLYIEQLSLSPDREWIAFDSNQSGNMDIWLMRKNGSELRQLTTNSTHDWYPQWSPDGRKIVFHSLRSGNRDLYVMSVAGGGITPLTNHPAQDLAPHWSPDGNKIAFISNRNGNMDAWVIPSDGGEPRQLTSGVAQDFLLTWSPDGKRIIFSSNRTGDSELFLMPAEGGEPLQLTHGAWYRISPLFWSEDGHTIYSFGVGGPGSECVNLWAISDEDGSARSLIDFQNSLKEPSHSLSSDGERIYFPLWEGVGDLWMAELSREE